MPSASGNIISQNGKKFIATFLIDEIQYSFAGSLDPSVQSFNCSNATLTYGSVGDLTTTRAYEGQVGVTKVTFTVANGAKLEGPLNLQISPASTVAGNGTWTSN
ncbi:hypothetical protein BDZ94DRAFT_939035 [Collybia nuda]|uniref:Uncharacterized protein n=1 Tax=Collybia nuda TaxID=64659 RepID=A0A9P5XZ27_9AGAR|nr:hypothetical protein BDZ94DRAFT_188072 [Collybia nuda]KAF9460263.1 hypothetical protein BDZ94DRAFT_939035 [Collybia nuda]